MKPMWVIVCVCVGVAIVFMSFLEMLRFPGAKKLIFPHFWHRIPHINWLLPQLCKKQKIKPLQTHNSAIQWTHFPCAPVCYSTHDWASAFDQSCFGWFEIFGLDTDINIHALANTLTHTIFPICFFFSTNDRWVQFLVYWLNAFMELHLWSRLGFRGKTNRPD